MPPRHRRSILSMYLLSLLHMRCITSSFQGGLQAFLLLSAACTSVLSRSLLRYHLYEELFFLFPLTSHPPKHSCLASPCSPQFLFWGWKAPCSTPPLPSWSWGFEGTGGYLGFPLSLLHPAEPALGTVDPPAPWYSPAPSPWWKTLFSLQNKSVSTSAALRFPCFSPERV